MLGMGVGALPRLPLHDLAEAVLSLNPTTEHVLDSLGIVRDIAGSRWDATYTGSPTLAARGRPTLPRGVTFSGTGQYATTSGSVPTPTTRMSALAVYATTDATASARYLLSRSFTGEQSWDIRLSTGHTAQFVAKQAGGSTHATASVSGATNDGAPHLAVGTFDGTTISTARDGSAAVTSTTLTGSWNTATTRAVSIASQNSSGGSLFPGTIYLVAYWNDRIITDTERRWLYSIMAGG